MDEKGILTETRRILKDDDDPDVKLKNICQLLESRVDHYDWVGFYLVDPDEEGMLVLGPYVGEPTEHTRIPFGSGICGQAAQTGKLFLVQDVQEENNYLSCSPDVRSEIVLPIRRDGEIVGELDIDSNDLSPFTESDNRLLKAICREVSGII